MDNFTTNMQNFQNMLSMMSGTQGNNSMPAMQLPFGNDTSGMLPNMAQNASMMQMVMADRQQANTIWVQMLADAQKQQEERFKILRDLQTKKFELQQEATNNWLGTSSKSNEEFCKAIMA